MNATTATLSTDVAYTPIPTASSAKSQPSRRRLPSVRILAIVVGVLIGGSGIAAYLHASAGFESTDDAFLEGNVHPVSARINGTVSKVLVDDNAHVNAGDPLVEIDAADLILAVQSAEADLAQAQANGIQMEAQITRAVADVEAATARIAQNAAELTRAELDFHRREVLASDEVHAIARQDLDSARAAFDAALAGKQSLIASRAAAEAGLAAAKAQRSVAHAQVQKAEAALATAKLQLDYTVIRAASAGRVAKKNVESGQRLQPGQPLMALVDDAVWIVANFKESQLAHLKPGETVSVKVDAVEGRQFQAKVESFSPGTGAKFSLLPPDNATGNFTKVVQRVPVKILFDADSVRDVASRLAPGMSVVVKVNIRG